MSDSFKKCIVLDLDNTLWGGVVGEDGPEGLALSLDGAGAGFIAFQQALLDHYHRGVILAIASRNNPEDAWGVIRSHPNMILKEPHFAAARINWNDKAENIRELAAELNIGLDAMVFLDDDATNRAQLRALLPEVTTPELPTDPAEYARFLNSLPYFPSAAATDEDTMRGNLYVTERLRKEAEKHYATREEFLGSLGLELIVRRDDPSSLPRLAQLTEKTNQFNTVKRPRSEDELAALMRDPGYHVYHARLLDRFGDHGIIALAIVELRNAEWHIVSLLMSCRVFGRNVEEAFASVIMTDAAAAGAERVAIDIEETAKNLPAREFVARWFPEGNRATSLPVTAPEWITITY